MLKRIWDFIKSIFELKHEGELPLEAKDALKLFKETILGCSIEQKVSWFGQQIVRYIDAHSGCVSYENGMMGIDVNIVACVPGDWGDEIFDTMYSTRRKLQLNTAVRHMYVVPNDYRLPENLRSKEHFIGVHWVITKKVTEDK